MNVLLLPLLLLLCTPLWSQADGGGSVIFPAERLTELREELVYEPEEERELVEPLQPIDWNLQLDNLRSPLVLAIAIALLLGLGLLIYRILGDLEVKRRRQHEAEAQGVNVTEIVEEELVEQGVSLSLLERAEAAGQYDIAVRLLYIALLKSLQDAGLLRYRRDFSNRDYRQQLREHPAQADFVRVTQAYERYWYGKYPIDRLSYRLVYKDFGALTDRIAPAITTSPHG
ncbi:DUF4129 domain-containing protein [Neolewinella sp.]|uniref:DUF4129 domain-containing protein n=1 Tax=Neolewinella sp. TaxID=2993543 RepID=UPI003B520776